MNGWALSVILLFANPASDPSAETPRITFAFPVGIRGGVGPIRGAGKLPYDPNIEFLGIFRQCGARNVSVPAYGSSRFVVQADSTLADRQLVSCVKNLLPRTFWVNSPTSDFKEFWSTDETQKETAN